MEPRMRVLFSYLLYLLCFYVFVLFYLQACFHKPKKFIFNNWRKENKYLPEDGQELTETCRRIIRNFKQYNYFNVLFLIK